MQPNHQLLTDPQASAPKSGGITYQEALKKRAERPTQLLSSSQSLLSLESVGRTDVGRDRTHNEDYFSIDQQHFCTSDFLDGSYRGLYILCDGMGGMAKGAVASKLATKTLRSYLNSRWQRHLPTEIGLELAINTANKAVYERNLKEQRAGSDRMGTTAVVVMVNNTHIRYVHIGDSRLYRLTRQSGLQLLTTDHNAYQRALQRGYSPEEAQAFGPQLTKALGPWSGESLHPQSQTLAVEEDTVFILCSDGLSDHDLLEKHTNSHLIGMLDFRTDLTNGMDQLMALANQKNGHDNITAIAVRLRPQP
ncbi:protein phosphatase 2C domain-containing protein [Acaryochloris sp. IP29b_bin.148]|uniref:protein phosphatase 2C domain-containing protein n=1 Tax=Acaryochloris sp. IP29b_bin.148 TaxID=2969218 RepID=UPI00262EF61C|nr:protein phosphatase 2C domain-containing protein [Acaryochloris sp. IP29b_bin.148]